MSTYLRLFLAMACLVCVSRSAGADCSKDQAHSKMRALQQIFTENSSVQGEEGRKFAFMARDTAMVGHLLASKDYGEACKQYDAIAQKYGVNLSATQKTLAPIIDAKAKAAGKCDSLAANLRVNGAYTKFQNKMKKEGASDNEIALSAGEFFQKLNPAFPLVQTKPDEACKIVAQLEKEYGLK